MTCCSKNICNGCVYASRERATESFDQLCPFCREPASSTVEECEKLTKKRIEAKDPEALCQEGFERYKKGDYSGAFEYYSKAAKLGDAEAHFKLAILYKIGSGVEKDTGKEMHHLEEAAIGGHPLARHQLGCHEASTGNDDRAVKYWIIAARQGEENSMKALMNLFKGGFISKEDLAATLRAHHVAVEATKSP